jgi:V/A-type H+-transporting ATPase subunit I
MIVAMKKVSFLITDSMRQETLDSLKALGAVHLEPVEGSGERLEDLKVKHQLLERAFFSLPQLTVSQKSGAGTEDALVLAGKILELNENRQKIQETRDRYMREVDVLKDWGDFDPKDILSLKEEGINLRLVTAQKSANTDGFYVFTIKQEKQRSLLALIGEDELGEGLAEMPLPQFSLSEYAGYIERALLEIDKITTSIEDLCIYKDALEKAMKQLEEEIEYEEFRTGMSEAEDLLFFSGFVPSDKTGAIADLSKKVQFAYIIQDPKEDDVVPTKVENNPLIRIIQPVFDLMGTVPGYRERDISALFLLFFSLFFAMIIGDAGYGMMFFVTGVILSLKSVFSKKKVPDIILLLTLMGFTTTAWGAITGNWFGFEFIADLVPFRYLVIPQLDSFSIDSAESVMLLSFIIGTVHLSIAHIWNMINNFRKGPFLQGFGQLGWFLMVVGLINFVLFLILGAEKYPLQAYSLPTIFAGLGMVLIFSYQEGNFFKGLLGSLANILPIFLDSIAVFSDIVSYIRLFAVGLASLEIAKAFNSMAMGLGDGWSGIIFGGLIILVGHTLNLVMGLLSVVVHGVRLKMLEFSGHLGMEWTGIAYSPFRRKDI